LLQTGDRIGHGGQFGQQDFSWKFNAKSQRCKAAKGVERERRDSVACLSLTVGETSQRRFDDGPKFVAPSSLRLSGAFTPLRLCVKTERDRLDAAVKK
jgi:hypothetical protein